MRTPIIQLSEITKDYILDEITTKVLHGISVTINKGDFIAITGPSGSGKSTLLNIIGLLDNASFGKYILNGKDVTQLTEDEQARVRNKEIGFVFQAFNLLKRSSVLDNVILPSIYKGMKKSEREVRATDLLNKVGLSEQIYKKPNQLSGGQQQRVAIARALINSPKILLADEPTGSLDTETSEQILILIKKIANQGKLVIMVTHSEKVAEYSDRVITISDGLITKDEIKVEDKKMIIGEEKINTGKQNLSFKDAVGMALKNMKEKLGRNLLVSIGASIGITSVIIMLSIGNGVSQYMTNTMNEYVNPNVVEVHQMSEEESSQSPQNGPPGEIMGTEAKPFEQTDIDQLTKIKNVDKVELAYSKLSFRGNTAKIGDKESSFQTLSTLSSNITSENITSGVLPVAGEVLVSAKLAAELDDSIIGKSIVMDFIIGETKFSESFKVSGIFGEIAENGMNDFSTIFINYADLTKLAKAKDVVIKPNTVYLVTDNKDNVKEIKDKVLALGYTGSMEERLLGMFTEMLDVVTYILAAIAAISLVVSAIMILVVMYISVVERTREIGVLKAIGARRKDIKRIFVAESFLIGLVSGLFGLFVAVLLMLGINAITRNQFSVDLVIISATYALFGVLVSVGISILAGLAPASKAAKLDPVESLRRE